VEAERAEQVKTEAPEQKATEAAFGSEQEDPVIKAEPEMPARENVEKTEDVKHDGESNGYGGIRKPLFQRFNPRNAMVFNRNGFPRKNSDLRVALSELQKSADPKPQISETNPEVKHEEATPGQQNAEPKPDEDKES